MNRSIHFYNYERIQLKTGEVPLARRPPPKTLDFLPEVLLGLSA